MRTSRLASIDLMKTSSLSEKAIDAESAGMSIPVTRDALYLKPFYR